MRSPSKEVSIPSYSHRHGTPYNAGIEMTCSKIHYPFNPSSFLASMSANPGPLTLWCLIEGDSKPFEVEVPPSASIANLKNRVHNKGINVATHNIDAIDLVLWKVLYSQSLHKHYS